MRKLTKTLTFEEAKKVGETDYFMARFISLFSRFGGVKFDSIKDVTIKCTDDKYGQLTDLHITFNPLENEEKELFITHCPWLKRSDDSSEVLYVKH